MTFGDEVASRYDDNRLWEYENPEARALVLSRRLRLGSEDTLLDVCCGTGFYTSLLAQGAGCKAIGVDASQAMLDVAGEKEGIAAVYLGSAEHLPVTDGSVTALLCHNAIHLVRKRRTFVEEALRVLVPGGRLAIVTVSHDQMRRHPIYQHFPGLLEVELNRHPGIEELEAFASAGGFARVQVAEVDGSVKRIAWPSVIECARAKFMSSMRTLSDAEFRHACAIFEGRVRRLGGATCPAESYTVLSGTAR